MLDFLINIISGVQVMANEFVVSFAKTFCYNEMVRYASIIKYYNIPVKESMLIILMC